MASLPPLKRNKGMPMTSKEKMIVLNLWNYFREQFPDQKVENITRETAKASGASERSIYRIRSEIKKTSTLVAQGKKKPKLAEVRKIHLDDLTRSGVRKHVHNFFRKNETPNGEKVTQAIAEDETMPTISRYKVHSVLKELGFKFKRRQRRNILIEKSDIVHARVKYLRAIAQFRESGRPIFYLDETWLGQNHGRVDVEIDNTKKTWIEGLAMGPRSNFSKSKEERLIVLDVGSDAGFLEGAGLIFRTGGKNKDYHGDMNGEKFERWFCKEVIPRLPPDSVVVMDDAPYHNVQVDKPPSSTYLKRDMQAWLTARNIPWQSDMVKVELHELIKQAQPREKKYKIDEIAKQHGHIILRLPPYHCELNPMELVWSKMKGYVASQNTSFKMEDVERLSHEACGQIITPADWSSYCRHIKAQERVMIEYESTVDNLVDSIILSVGDNDVESEMNSEGESESDFEEETSDNDMDTETKPLDLRASICTK